MNHNKTAEYIEAHNLAAAELKAGNIQAFCTGYSRERGRYIEYQVDGVWSPYPWWQEIEPECVYGPDERQDIYL